MPCLDPFGEGVALVSSVNTSHAAVRGLAASLLGRHRLVGRFEIGCEQFRTHA